MNNAMVTSFLCSTWIVFEITLQQSSQLNFLFEIAPTGYCMNLVENFVRQVLSVRLLLLLLLDYIITIITIIRVCGIRTV